jgi:YjbE family integral membrane protein
VTGDQILRALQIVFIDIALAGDNAVVIAMAVRSLPPPQRRTGTIAGAAGAIILRIALTFFAARILELPYLKLAGGVLIFWIAVRLIVGADEDPNAETAAKSLRQAIWMILAADTTMSLDNILAVAAVSKGSLVLLIAGLGLSISFVMFMSRLLAQIMDRYPIVLWAGAAVLGRVAGEMIATDPWVTMKTGWVESWPAEVIAAALVIAAGLVFRRKKNRKKVEAVSVI